MKYFRIAFIDDETKTIGFSEIISDDTEINNRTVELQKLGKQVHVSTCGKPKKSADLVTSIETLKCNLISGYTYDENLRW